MTRSTITLDYYVDIQQDLPAYVAYTGNWTKLMRIPLERIVPTQRYVVKRHVEHYLKRMRMTDDEGELPFAVRFSNEPHVYLLNGHHRWYAARLKGRTHLRLKVNHYPQMTLIDAVLERQAIIETMK